MTALARSAPEKPGVPWAIFRRSTPSASGLPRQWTFRIASRPSMSGASITTWRSKRPGRSRALSRTSGRLVAARRITPTLAWKPSISTSSWLRVCSRSSLTGPRCTPRSRPMASNSSMKMMQGACCWACSNRSRTRAAPTPTNISTKSLPLSEKKGTLGLAGDRPGRAASCPVPGQSDQQHALGNLGAQGDVAVGVLQEIDDLLKLVLGLVAAGHVVEGDARVAVGHQPRPALAEAHHRLPGGPQPSRQEDPHHDHHADRQHPGIEELGEEAGADAAEGDLGRFELADQLRVRFDALRAEQERLCFLFRSGCGSGTRFARWSPGFSRFSRWSPGFHGSALVVPALAGSPVFRPAPVLLAPVPLGFGSADFGVSALAFGVMVPVISASWIWQSVTSPLS